MHVRWVGSEDGVHGVLAVGVSVGLLEWRVLELALVWKTAGMFETNIGFLSVAEPFPGSKTRLCLECKH